MDKNKTWCVYIHTSPKNKAYIGITCQNPEYRWRKDGTGYKEDTQPVMYAAIQKYGWNNFTHYIFADNLTKEEAKHMEMLLIALYKTNCSKYSNPSYGYNLTDGGDGTAGRQTSDETRAAMSESAKNRFLSQNERAKISNALTGLMVGDKNPMYGVRRFGSDNPNYGNHKLAGKNNPNYGKCHSEETKNKIQSKQKCKQVICVETGKIYCSIREAARQTGFSQSHISKCCRGIKGYETVGKLHWRFIIEEGDRYENISI
jgi:group I intron endonuclease